jgi:hypothetical protein
MICPVAFEIVGPLTKKYNSLNCLFISMSSQGGGVETAG